jgi:hypothetical protein
MLTAMAAVDNIKHHVKDKANIWQINTEKEYHESKSDESTSDVTTPEVKTTAMGNLKQQLKDLSRQFVGYLFTGS